MVKRSAILGLSIGLGIIAPQSQSSLGCYAIQPYVWSRTLDAIETTLYSPPDTFRLYSSRGSEEVGRRRLFEAGRLLVRPPIPKAGSGGSVTPPQAYWYERTPDSLEVIWTNGFTGAHITATRKNGQLVGRLDWVSDAIGLEPHPHAAVLLTSIPCPVSLPDTVEVDHRD